VPRPVAGARACSGDAAAERMTTLRAVRSPRPAPPLIGVVTHDAWHAAVLDGLVDAARGAVRRLALVA
jgi:hypothetical protein